MKTLALSLAYLVHVLTQLVHRIFLPLYLSIIGQTNLSETSSLFSWKMDDAHHRRLTHATLPIDP